MPPPPLPQRRATRPRPIRRRVFVRSSDTLEAIIASGQATLAARAAAAMNSPAVGAGEESFAASPLALSPAPSSPASSLPAIAWPASPADPRAADPRAPAPRTDFRAVAPRHDPRAAAPPVAVPSRADPRAAASRADVSAAPRAVPAPASAATPTAAPRASLQPAAPATLSPSPHAPRFPAPQDNIAVGRFPSPPQRRGEKTPAFTPPNMPALSPEPMETAPASEPGPSYAAAAAAAKRPKTTPSGTAPVRAPAPAPAAAATVDPSKTPKPKAARYPPLIVEVLPDWPTHFRELKRLLGHAPNGRPFGKGVRFIPKSDQEFRAIQRYLTQLESASGISWFCYSLPAERSLKVAIRGLPANTEPELVEAELRELGYVPEHVRTIPARPGRPGCLMFAQLQRTPDITPGIYEVHELLCMPGITIEAWRGRKGPAQCHRCQQWRHSSVNCHRPLVCVACAGNHAARDCPRPKEEPPTCANCGDAHTANNANCPVFRKELRNRRAGTVARTAPAHAAAAASTTEANAPGSLMAAANQPQQQPGRKRRRRRGKRAQPRHDTAPAAPQPSAKRPTAAASAAPAAPQPPTKRPTAAAPAPPAAQSKPTVVAAPARETKAKRKGAPRPAPQPAPGHLDSRLTKVIGTLHQVLLAIQEQRDPAPLILACIMELCSSE
ncbi:transcription initiation factor TFIID subunit 4-like [Maniola jurtina]|uniref:transcription initiation factor TFIID subunit 4-like n=1 Tax=Maniola jurtina TaxID=191418 RepID=UPI001E68D5F9|nr:transcription initiation factor TFIID subunit 4-like [Maniola jurtina]